jgi:hypothetical protein
MNKVIIALLGIITAVVLLVGGFYLGQQLSTQPSTQEAVLPTQTPEETPMPNQTGTIEGSLSYPSEGIPEDMFVCAETLAGVQAVCTSEHIDDPKYEYGEGYILEMAPGTYYVYAQIPGDDYKAYYTEHVTCGLTVECESHEKIEVVVEASQTTSNVDPIDWYNTGSGQ